MSRLLTVISLLAFTACGSDPEPDPEPDPVDADGDGVYEEDDCNDNDASIYPGADEVCDAENVDENCNDLANDDDPDTLVSSMTVFYPDSDGDTFGNMDDPGTSLCEDPSDETMTYVLDATDCDDERDDVYPGAPEVCDEADTDEDCDGTAEDADADSHPDTKTPFFPDVDKDFYGDMFHSGGDYCDDPSTATDWWPLDNSDCDDDNSSIHPTATDPWHTGVDENCDDVGAEQWLSEADVKLLGEAEGDGAGRSVASAGDVNNDGYDDILIGASGDDTNASNAGATYLIYGSAEGIESMNLADADVKMTGVELGDLSGYSVSSAGDVNNDGYDDILIGSPYVEDAKLGTEVGATYVVMGSADPLTDISLEDADVILIGEERGDRSARIISGAGDINDDGFDDILISAYFAENRLGSTLWNAGAAYVLLGTKDGIVSTPSDPDTKLSGEGEYDGAGCNLSDVGDINGDGLDDILIGSWLNDNTKLDAGTAYLFLGNESGIPSGSLGNADAQYTGEGVEDWAGYYLDNAGDTNGDGYSDMLIGSYKHDTISSDEGAAYLILGSKDDPEDMSLGGADAKISGVRTGAVVGNSLAGAGDINGDTYDDILIGASRDDTGYSQGGTIYVVLGESGGIASMDSTDAEVALLGEAASDNAGGNLATAGDINNDGFDEILIGVTGHDETADKAGAVYLFYGL